MKQFLRKTEKYCHIVKTPLLSCKPLKQLCLESISENVLTGGPNHYCSTIPKA